MKYNRMFQPITINGMELKNRLVMPAIHNHYTEDGFCNEKLKAFYNTRAEGGVGLIIIGGCRFDDYGAPAGMISFQEDKFIPGYKEFAAGIHARGAKVAAQLYHAGRYTRKRSLPAGMEALAPSALVSGYTREMPKEMTKEEINEVIRGWAAAAKRVKEADFDAVEILGSAGYLICQFLSPVSNIRTDEYGGSWENRCRFPLQVIAAVREAVGPDFPIIMRISGNDFVKGSNTNAEAVAFAKLIEQAGVDMINVTGGWHETLIPQLPGEVPRAGYTYLAQAVKEAVSVPVLACNRLNDPDVAEEVLALGKADMVGLARMLLADPEWPNKAREGRQGEIRHCVGCNQGCLANTFFGKPVECLVNGRGGHEDEITMVPTENPKNILVIGAGPAGMEFAIEAAERGHKITLWEKDTKLGGQLNLVSKPEGKAEFATLTPYYETMMKKLGVTVVMGKTADAKTVKDAGFDEVVVATGATPRRISLPNDAGKIPTYTAAEVLAGDVIPGKNVVVIGGGAVGCETAQLMARRGALTPEQLMFLTTQRAEVPEKITALLNNSARKVTIVEVLKNVGNGFDPGCGWPVLKDMKRLGVTNLTLSTVTGVTETEVVVEKKTEDGTTEIRIPCDTIVLAVGSVADNALYNELSDAMPNVHLIGDATKPGKVLAAIHQAMNLAAKL